MSGSTDSAGQSWAGRELHGTGFDDDFGVGDPALLAALADPNDEVALMAALADSRLIVPIVAAPSEVDDSGDLAVEKSTDMAVVTLTASDGQRALPVFSSLETLQRWDPRARPSPVTAAVAAQAAVAERCDVMALDPSSPTAVVLRSSMVWALAQQRAWVPAHADPLVQQSVSRAVHDEPAVQRAECEPAPGALRVVLWLRAGLAPDQVQALAQRVGERIATDGEARARIDALAFAIRSS